MLDRYAVIGNPIAHSQSPAIHAAFAEQTGQAMDYARVLAPLDGFAQTVRALQAGGVKGANVTVPFKFEAYALAAEVSDRAQLARAANTLIFHGDGRIEADNTDGAGLVADVVSAIGSLSGLRVLVIGAGGAVAGVLPSLLSAGVSELILLNRTPAKAIQMINDLSSWGLHKTTLRAGGLDEPVCAVDLIINGTSSGLSGQAIPLPPEWCRGIRLAYDMMYGARPTPFMAWATTQGAPVRDGLGMLVGQAAEAFYRWRGVAPDTAPVLEQLRAALLAKVAAA